MSHIPSHYGINVIINLDILQANPLSLSIGFVLKKSLQTQGSLEETTLINAQILPKCAMIRENLSVDIGARRDNDKKLKYDYKNLVHLAKSPHLKIPNKTVAFDI